MTGAGGVAGERGRHCRCRDRVRSAADDPVCRHLRDLVSSDDAVIYGVNRDRDSLRHRHRPPVRRARGRRGIPPVPASGRERGDRVRRRLGWRRAIGVALAWTEPYWVPEPILILALYILIGKRDRIRGKGHRYGARGCRGDTRGDHRSASRSSRRSPRLRSCSRVHAGQEVLAHVRPVHVLGRALSRLPGQVGYEQRNAASRSSSELGSSSSGCSSFMRSAHGSPTATHSPSSRQQPDPRGHLADHRLGQR